LKCNRCNLDSHELVWDQEYHDLSGKWRLFHQGQGRPHDCKPTASVQEAPPPPKKVKCPKCDPLRNESWMNADILQNHLKNEHFGFW